MSSHQNEVFKFASPIAEIKIRRARAMQAAEALSMMRQTVNVIVGVIRRKRERAQRNVEV